MTDKRRDDNVLFFSSETLPAQATWLGLSEIVSWFLRDDTPEEVRLWLEKLGRTADRHVGDPRNEDFYGDLEKVVNNIETD